MRRVGADERQWLQGLAVRCDQVGTEAQKRQMLERVAEHALELAVHTYVCTSLATAY